MSLSLNISELIGRSLHLVAIGVQFQVLYLPDWKLWLLFIAILSHENTSLSYLIRSNSPHNSFHKSISWSEPGFLTIDEAILNVSCINDIFIMIVVQSLSLNYLFSFFDSCVVVQIQLSWSYNIILIVYELHETFSEALWHFKIVCFIGPYWRFFKRIWQMFCLKFLFAYC